MTHPRAKTACELSMEGGGGIKGLCPEEVDFALRKIYP